MTTLQTDYTAKHRYARLTARKARLIADLIRNRSANEAFELLEFAPQRAASFYLRLLKSAVANAAQDESVDLNRLVIVDARADDGPLLNNRMRWRPGPQGRAMPFTKKTSHLTIAVAVYSDSSDVATSASIEKPVEEPVEKPEPKPEATPKKTEAPADEPTPSEPASEDQES